MENEQQTTEHTDTSFHFKSVRFMCTSCNRDFRIPAPENNHGTCPRCDSVSDVILTDDNATKDNKTTTTTTDLADNQNLENANSQNTQPQNPDQPPVESPTRPQFRVVRIVRRIIFRPGGVIVIESVLPFSETGEQPNESNPAANSENAANSESPSQEHADHHPHLNSFEMLLQSLFDSNGFDRLIEEFLRNDPNVYGSAPASEENINSLKEFNYESENCKNSQCSVCQEEYIKDDKCFALPCEHDYHKDCIIEWLKLHDSCPICRKPITSSQTKPQEADAPEQLN